MPNAPKMGLLERAVRGSVKHRVTVLIVSAMIMGVGLSVVRGLPIDAVPDVTNVQVSVLTPSPGLAPTEVEQYLTYPIEMALNGLPKLEQIRSISRTGVSAITVIFKDDVDIWFARYLVSERLRQAEASIPEGYGTPTLAPVSTGLGDIYEFVIHSNRHTPMELRTILDWQITPALRQVPGVIEVNAFGGEAKQFQVFVDPKKLAAHQVTLSQVIHAIENNNGAVGGGYIEKNSESIVVRGEGLAKSVPDLEHIVIKADENGTPLLLGQLSTRVRVGAALRFGTATQLKRGAVVTGTVMMLLGSNSREVVKAVKHKIKTLQKDLPSGVKIEPFTDREVFINRVLETVFRNLAEGAGLVVLVLLIALGSVSGSLLASLAIPFSMLVAVMAMRATGVVGNIMSLGAIDFGLLVDGAIVMLEAVMARLAISQASRIDIPDLIADAASKVAKPVAMAVSIIMLVYLPLMALEGVEGKMFRPMALTVAYALFGALVFTIATFPAALAVVMRPRKQKSETHVEHEHGRIFSVLLNQYRRIVSWSFDHTRLTLGVAFLCVVTALAAASRLGAEFVPRLFEGQFTVDVRRLPSIAISEAENLGKQLETVVSKFPEVLTVVTRTGRPEVATDPVGPDEAEALIDLKPQGEWTTTDDPEVLAERLKKAIVTQVPATYPSMSQPIENRVNQLLAGSRAHVVIKIFGDDIPTLKRLGDEIAASIEKLQGTGDLRVQRALGLELLEAKVDRARLARYGISVDTVLEAIEASRVGVTVGKVFEGSKRFDIVVKIAGIAQAEDPEEAVRGILIGSDTGLLVPLGQVADVHIVEGPAVINREALRRRLLVEVNVRGRDLVSYVKAAQQQVQQRVKLPAGYDIQWGGQFENFERASKRLMLVVPIALFIICAMLFLTFQTLRHTLTVFAAVPFGLVGGIAALYARSLPFSLPAGVGFIALCGVAVLNGVVMASDLIQRQNASDDFDEAVRVSALHALRPILTTAAVAALGFMPMAISTAPGAEVQRPLATVVIGGILSSTILVLWVLPVMLHAFCHPKKS